MLGEPVGFQDFHGNIIKFGHCVLTRNRKKYVVTEQGGKPYLVPLAGRGRLLMDKGLVETSEMKILN